MIASSQRTQGRRQAPSAEPPKPLRERLHDIRTAFGNIPGAFDLVWRSDKRSTLVMALLTLVSGFLPLGQAWVAGLILNSVTASFQQKLTPLAGSSAGLSRSSMKRSAASATCAGGSDPSGDHRL